MGVIAMGWRTSKTNVIATPGQNGSTNYTVSSSVKLRLYGDNGSEHIELSAEESEDGRFFAAENLSEGFILCVQEIN